MLNKRVFVCLLSRPSSPDPRNGTDGTVPQTCSLHERGLPLPYGSVVILSTPWHNPQPIIHHPSTLPSTNRKTQPLPPSPVLKPCSTYSASPLLSTQDNLDQKKRTKSLVSASLTSQEVPDSEPRTQPPENSSVRGARLTGRGRIKSTGMASPPSVGRDWTGAHLTVIFVYFTLFSIPCPQFNAFRNN